MRVDTLITIFWQSVLGAAVFSWPIFSWLRSNVKQKIDPYAPEGHQLKKGTPTMGGLIVIAGALCGLIAERLRSAPIDFKKLGSQDIFLFLIISFGLIGFVDDFVIPRMIAGKRGLGWKQKFLMEIVFGGVAASIAFPIFSFAWCVFLFLILFYSNAYNFADGLDGLSGSLWLALTVGVVGLATVGNPNAAAPMIAIAGGIVVFLFYNAPPAKIFMGDVGSLPLGATLGAGVGMLFLNPTFESTGSAPAIPFLPLAILSFVMIAELVPVPLQVAYFKLTKGKRIFPATPIHHSFEKKGWPESRVVWAFALFQLLLSVAAISIVAK
jgi:phospho-N-acetylmuramoyl-pentapeptide-transferase